jgi:hypothetical protein
VTYERIRAARLTETTLTPRKPSPVKVSEKLRGELEEMARSGVSPAWFARRAGIALARVDEEPEIYARFDAGPTTVIRWKPKSRKNLTHAEAPHAFHASPYELVTQALRSSSVSPMVDGRLMLFYFTL